MIKHFKSNFLDEVIEMMKFEDDKNGLRLCEEEMNGSMA